MIDGSCIGPYQLIGVMLYKLDTHYIADVYDATYGWVRYDAYEPADGVGQRVQPPTGRTQHTHGLSGEYYPVELLYARISVGGAPGAADEPLAAEADDEAAGDEAGDEAAGDEAGDKAGDVAGDEATSTLSDLALSMPDDSLVQLLVQKQAREADDEATRADVRTEMAARMDTGVRVNHALRRGAR
jgi:hypothetical protein